MLIPKKRRFFPTGPLLVFVFVLCSWPGTASCSDPETLVIADRKGDWGFPAPYTHIFKGPGAAYTSLVFDTLLWKDRTGAFVPALAKSWVYREKENAWAFWLQENAKWHDGMPVTPEDVVFTLAYSHDHPYCFSDTTAIDRVEKTGNHEVTIFLKSIYNPFLSDVAGTLFILPRHIYKDVASPETFRRPEAAIGSGPYRLRQYDKAKGQYLFEAFEDYYQGSPRIRRISILKMPPPVAVKALSSGRVDMIDRVPFRFVPALEKMGARISSAQSGVPTRLVFNHTKPPFSDKRVRQALAYAIDRKTIAAISQGGRAVPGNPGGISTANPWHTTDLPAYVYNPERAWQLLKSAGFKKDSKGRVIWDNKPWEMELLTEEPFERDGTLIGHQLEKQGITLNLRVVSRPALVAKLKSFEFDACLELRGTLGDPQGFARRVLGTSPYNDRFFSNPELTRLLKENISVKDPVRRRTMVDRAQKIYAEELPAYALYCPIWYAASSSKIDPFFTPGGLACGIPLALNKLIFIR